MIPFPVAPLRDVTVLVTRPADQAASLCASIDALGGEALAFPAIAIESIAIESLASSSLGGEYDWVVFVSVNAVTHGLPHIKRGPQTRIAAIGKSTATLLESHEIRIDAVPDSDFTSEALLTHPALSDIASQRVLIVKGAGGRELLHATLLERGAQVATVDVYRRVLPVLANDTLQTLERRWQEGGIDITTLTSVETLDNLTSLLTEIGRSRLQSTPFVAVSERIAAAARSRGLTGTCVLARNADDASIVGAIAAWHARAR